MKRRLLTLIAALLCTATLSRATNIAPNGTAYGWNANTSSTANTNRSAQPGLNDNNLTGNVDLDSAGDAIGAWEGAGVVWTTPANISSVDFINGDITTGGDGYLTANCTLQFSTDGSTWTNSGWTCSPAYPNSSSAGGQTYTFTGTAVSGVLGARVVGQVRTTDTSYHWIVKEVQVTGSLGTNYTITASAGTGGSISPTGNVSVSPGANQTYSIAANSGYVISGVTVDGASVGAVSSYTFSNVQANHTISAAFSAVTTAYTITASAGTGGSISPSGAVTVNQGTSQTFTIAASSGYSITSVTVDGASVGAVSSYTFSNVQANHTIGAAFSAATSTNIAPSGTAYGWSANTSSTANTNRAAQAGLNDNNLTNNVDLDPAGDAIGAWEGAGVVWSSAVNITSAKFINGDITTGGDGYLTANCTLQYSTDGSTWTNTGWTITPTYPNSSSAGGQTYSASGTALNGVLGMRFVGQVRTTDTSYHWIVKEVQFIGATSGGTTPVATPTFSPAAGTYSSAQSVTIATTTSGATIRYTTDGSTPSETAGTVYSGPIAVSATTTINAIAYETGYSDSAVASATYTITVPQVAAPTFSPAGGTYSSAQSVTIATTTSGATIRYTIDGSTPTETNGTVYSGPVAISATTTVKAIAYESGFSDSTVSTATYTISLPQAAAPTFSPAGGTYSTAQSVTLATTTNGATIRYTTDGSTPSETAGTVYSGPISVSATTTINAIAYESGYSDSTVASATYTIGSSTTITSATGFYNQALPSAQTGTFTAAFDASVSLSPSNALVSLSQGAQSAYSGLAAIVRFNPSGDIDARNGGAYAAATTIPYSANTTYHFRLVINVPAHTYSAYVTPAGGSEITIGTNYGFRTEQAGVTQLDTWNADVSATPGGSETIGNVTISLPAPDFTIAASPASQSLAAGTNTTYTATISPLNGFTGAVNLSVSGLPSGANGTFSPASITGSGSSTLTVATTTTATQGTYNLTVTGTSGSLTHSSNVSIVITSPSGWIHPGVGVTKAMLDYSKAQALAGVEPWKTALNNMINDPTYGPLSYTPKPWQTVECGSSSNPNYGCSDERRDSMAAYTQALLWYFTGNATYAQNAIKIMNAWSSTLTGGHTNSNAPLQTGWTGSVWPRAAEIIRCTNAGWSASDVAAFQNMLTTQYLPYVINGGCQNGNWEAVEALAVVNIAIFNEDKTSYDKGVALWRGRCPAYIYLTTDGPSPLAPPNCSLPSWYGETTFVDGIAQETCRDFGHTEWGIEALVLLAESARCQGQDLYSENYRRFLNGYEFHCTYLNGAAVPSWLCGGTVSLGYVQCFECGYNELVNRLGYTMPQTAQYLATKRPTGVNYFVGWETMTYYGQGNN